MYKIGCRGNAYKKNIVEEIWEERVISQKPEEKYGIRQVGVYYEEGLILPPREEVGPGGPMWALNLQ